MSPAMQIKLANWISQVNDTLSVHDEQLDYIVDSLLNHSSLHSSIITRLEAQNARLTALEDKVEGFLREVSSSPQIEKTGTLDLNPDTEVAEYNEDDKSKWCEECEEYTDHRIDSHVRLSDDPAFTVSGDGIVIAVGSYEYAREQLQKLFERR